MRARPIKRVDMEWVTCTIKEATHIELRFHGPIELRQLPIVLSQDDYRPFETWLWNGSTDYPTLSPSIATTSYNGAERIHCHSFVTLGQVEYLDDCTHELKGSKHLLKDFDIESPISTTKIVKREFNVDRDSRISTEVMNDIMNEDCYQYENYNTIVEPEDYEDGKIMNNKNIDPLMILSNVVKEFKIPIGLYNVCRMNMNKNESNVFTISSWNTLLVMKTVDSVSNLFQLDILCGSVLFHRLEKDTNRLLHSYIMTFKDGKIKAIYPTSQGCDVTGLNLLELSEIKLIEIDYNDRNAKLRIVQC